MNKAMKMLMLRDRPREADPHMGYGQPEQTRPRMDYGSPDQRRPIYAPVHITRQEYEIHDRGPMREPRRSEPQRRDGGMQQAYPPYWEKPWRRDAEMPEMPESAFRPTDGDEDWAEPYRESRTVGFGDRDDMESRRGRARNGQYKKMGMTLSEDDDGDQEDHHQMKTGKIMEMPHKLDDRTAREWVGRMQNADGTKGPHWTMDQTKQFAQQKSVDCDPLEFWVAMNMMYSDYCAAAKKLQMNTVDFYLMLAQAFLDDKDAGEGKLAKYYQCIVK